MRRRFAIGIALLAACGDDGMKLEDFLAARRQADCTRLTRCGMFTGEDICNAYFRLPHDESLIKAVRESKISYDGNAAGKCIEAVAATSCDKTQRDVREGPVACAKVFTGKIGDGAACAFSTECRSGLCYNVPCARDGCCPSTCAPSATNVAIDGACETDEQCVAGAFCHKNKTCQARFSENARCDDEFGCRFGLACVGITEFDAGTCRKLPLVGESCPYNLCAEINAVCVNFTCVALALPGAACTTDADCSIYAECHEATGKCIETPRLGDPCEFNCAGESWCDANTCVVPLEDSAPCEDNDKRCLSNLCVDGVVFEKCVPYPVCT